MRLHCLAPQGGATLPEWPLELLRASKIIHAKQWAAFATKDYERRLEALGKPAQQEACRISIPILPSDLKEWRSGLLVHGPSVLVVVWVLS